MLPLPPFPIIRGLDIAEITLPQPVWSNRALTKFPCCFQRQSPMSLTCMQETSEPPPPPSLSALRFPLADAILIAAAGGGPSRPSDWPSRLLPPPVSSLLSFFFFLLIVHSNIPRRSEFRTQAGNAAIRTLPQSVSICKL